MRFQSSQLPGSIVSFILRKIHAGETVWLRFIALSFAMLGMLSHGGATGIPITDMFDGATGGLSNNPADKSLRDVMYFTNKAIIRVPAAKDIISFKINESSTLLLKTAFTAKVFFRLTYTDKDDVSTIEQNDRWLEITYDPVKNKTYQSHSDLIFDNAYGLSIHVVRVDITGAAGWDPIPALQLTMEIRPDHLYQFDRVQNAVNQFTNAQLNEAMPIADELSVSWNAVTGASEYDIEWSYVDLYASAELRNLVNAANPLEADLERLVYRNNASRVTVNDITQQYAIPLYYDGQGTLVYRIRSVQTQPNGQRLEAVWSKSAKFDYLGHQAKLNWQASTSFAEDGKRKSVLQYFDGSLRNRQTVTKDNTTQTTVVAETIYDYQGRPAIQVLPAPTLQKLITYTPSFNSINNAAYDKDNFDLLPNGQAVCQRPGDPFSTQSGASKYYSPDNPLLANTELLKTEPYHQYIPDAQGFPFTETQYMQDGTGRVFKQGGVGPTHQIGSSHETVYYYGNPDQQELDALFGTEVGDASHYFKNMVRDANGQYSVSYLDMHGRTIATALAGDLPAGSSLENLPSKNAQTITKTLTDNNNNLVKGWTIESSKGLIVTKGGANNFTYSFDPSTLVLPSCPPVNQNFYYQCKYDLEITITGDCNNAFNAGQPYVRTEKNFTLGQIDATSPSTSSFHYSFSKFLPEGSYTVTKKLTISADALNYYRDQVFLTNNTCKTLDQFILEQKAIFATLQLNCNPTYSNCISTLGTPETFRTKYLTNNGIDPLTVTAVDEKYISLAYNNALAECARLQINETNGQNDFQSIYQSMLADVTPGGQYANLEAVDDYSVFSRGPDPHYYKYANSTFQYKNELGQRDLDVKSLYGAYDADPDNRVNATAFVLNFKPTWAETLVQAHPEYCKYQAMKNLVGEASYSWDNDFLNTKTYAEAQAKGYLNPTGKSSFTNLYATSFAINSSKLDPLSQQNTQYKNDIESFMLSAYTGSGTSYSLWTVACATGFCKDNYDINCRNNQVNHPFNVATGCTADMDNAWIAFRSMYYSKKRELIRNIINTAACFIDYTTLAAPVSMQTPDITANISHTLYFNNPATGLPGFEPGSTINSSSPQQVENQKQQGYSTTCQGYSELWWSQLQECLAGKLDNQKTNIINDLVSVCVMGSDETHMSGSSTINPAKTNPYTSFEAVLKHYIEQYNATVTPPSRINTVTCNGLLISFPLSYETVLPVNKPVISKPDDCECAQIALVRGKYNALPAGVKDASFSDYMLRTQKVTISNADLDMLTSLCSGVDCKFIPTPINLPPGLQCGATDVCVSCSQVNAVYNAFKTDYPGVTPAMEDVEDLQRSYNRLFEKYMNSRLGFGKQADEYLSFMKTCGDANTNTACNDLDNVLSNYAKVRSDGVEHYGDDDLIISDLSTVVSNGVMLPSQTIRDGNFGLFTEQSIRPRAGVKLCFNNNYSVEWKFKFPQSGTNVGTAFYVAGSSLPSAVFQMINTGPAPGLYLGNFAVEAPVNGCSNWGYYNNSEDYPCRNFPGTNQNSILAVPGVNALDEWVTIRIGIKNGMNQLYCNGNLVFEIPRTATTPMQWGFSQIAFQRCKDFSIDWVRVYGDNEALVYNEDFNNPQQPATLNGPICGGYDCQLGFTSYFNQQKGTNYSFAQIEALYQTTCGKSLNVCSSGSQLIDSLKNITNNFPGWYSYLDDATVNKASIYNDFSNWTTGGVTNLGYRSQLKFNDLNLSNGSLKMPSQYSYITYGSIGYTPKRSFCVNNDYAFEARIKNTYGGWTLSTGISNASHNTLATDPDEDFGFGFEQSAGNQWWYNYRHVRTYFDPGPINRSFDDWRIVKYVAKPDKFQVFLDGVLVIEVPRDGRSSIYRVSGGGFTAGNGLTLEMDWYKQYQDGQLVYQEDFNLQPGQYFSAPNPLALCPKPDCKAAFVSYFNLYYGNLGLKTYEKIDSFYTANGLTLGIPCPADATANILLCGRNEALVKQIENYHEDTPCDDELQFSTSRGTELYNAYREKISGDFLNAYMAECLKAVDNESFTVSQQVSEYHYTLYYYDQAGNLVKTVPPEGVQSNYTGAWMQSVKTARASNTAQPAVHNLITQYKYNSLNQVVTQVSPDGGLSNFWYDILGRLAISQNNKQQAEGNNYSYTKYDPLGRIKEVGQIDAPAQTMNDGISRVEENLSNWLNQNSNKRNQITSTQYDLPGKDLSPYATIKAKNMRNRVAFTSFTPGNNPAAYATATYYDYDIHGNVSTLVQDYGDNSLMANNGQQYKRMDYNYDLISGKVNQVSYQAGFKDQFFHKYTYDAENRLTCAFTSFNNVLWDKEADYQYYKHGPLARTELGGIQHLQGMDYAYTLQGWLKSVNGTTLQTSGGADDMGADGGVNRSLNAQDVYGYSLHYYDNDYISIGRPSWLTGLATKLQGQNAYRPLYNGNISSMAVNLPVINGVRGTAPMLYNYTYDQLNRITAMDAFKGSNTGPQLWDNNLVSTPEWKENITYDANGNIKTYNRNGDNRSAGNLMDQLHYSYKPGTNQLLQVTDDFTGNTPSDYNDIKSQPANNYIYDQIGNLVHDEKEGLNTISWSVYGKINSITKASGNIAYTYDASGNRISKTANGQTTWYVRDASGNTMAVYSLGDNTVNSGAITLKEQHIYGSSRLGIRTPNVNVTSLALPYTSDISTTTKSFYSIFDRGKKFFELSNHLGNVLVTISDKKSMLTADPGTNNGSCAAGTAVEDLTVPQRGTATSFVGREIVDLVTGFETGTSDEFIVSTNSELSACTPVPNNGNGMATVYAADVVSAQDYAPFGMEMVGRKYNSGSYRYGFNGKENDNEVKGGGNQQDYGMRIYDPRLGKFLSVDPLTVGYPMLTPYQFASNTPIVAIDIDGMEAGLYNGMNLSSAEKLYSLNKETNTKIVNGTADGVKESLKSAWNFVRRDAWKGETWKNAEQFLFEGALSMSSVKVANTPMVDAKTDGFINNVIKGDAYTRSKWVSGAATDILLAYAGDKGLGNLKNLKWSARLAEGTQVAGISGNWVSESIAGWSKKAIAYQEYVTGVAAGLAYKVGNVKFDGIIGNVLIDAKSSYDNFVNKATGNFYSWFKGSKSLIDQARSQINAANGASIEWNFSSQKTLDATKSLFKENNIEGITLKYNPQK